MKCHFECSPNFIGHNEVMTEMPNPPTGGQHAVYESFSVHQYVTLREAIPSEELVSGSDFKKSVNKEDFFPNFRC